jgi:hypothetical protein
MYWYRLQTKWDYKNFIAANAFVAAETFNLAIA